MNENTLTHSFKYHYSKRIKYITFLGFFIVGRSGYPNKGRNWGVSLQAKKFELSPSVGYHPHQKTEFSFPLIIEHILEKKYL